jgi:hypothetical protein
MPVRSAKLILALVPAMLSTSALCQDQQKQGSNIPVTASAKRESKPGVLLAPQSRNAPRAFLPRSEEPETDVPKLDRIRHQHVVLQPGTQRQFEVGNSHHSVLFVKAAATGANADKFAVQVFVVGQSEPVLVKTPRPSGDQAAIVVAKYEMREGSRYGVRFVNPTAAPLSVQVLLATADFQPQSQEKTR